MWTAVGPAQKWAEVGYFRPTCGPPPAHFIRPAGPGAPSLTKKAKKASRKEARAPQSRYSGMSACAIARGSRMAAASLSRAASVTFVTGVIDKWQQ